MNKRSQSLQDKQRKMTLECNIYILQYFLTHPCVDCGETDPIVLDFDHERDKKSDVCRIRKQGRLKALQEEIDKCSVRCANCHRKRHAQNTFRERGLSSLLEELNGFK